MKKDMGGAANVLGLASMIMAAGLKVRLRVLVPAVENSIAGNAFRPGDVLASRKGITVEIGNTDAEGRLVLADALALADEDEPQLLIDMATLTGAAACRARPRPAALLHRRRGACVRTDGGLDGGRRSAVAHAAVEALRRKLSSKIADINNVTTDGFAGSITAALFLKRFVEKTHRLGAFRHLRLESVRSPVRPCRRRGARHPRAGADHLERATLDALGITSGALRLKRNRNNLPCMLAGCRLRCVRARLCDCGSR